MGMFRRISIISALAGLPLAACASLPGGPSTPRPPRSGAEVSSVRAEVPRDLAPRVDEADFVTLAADNAAFAFDLYRALRGGEGNLVYSPYSVSTALAMTYAGAAGETARQMAETLRYTLPQERLHPSFNALGLLLDERNLTFKDADLEQEQTGVQLDVASALWGQVGFPFKAPFLETMARNYDAGVQQVDFENTPEPARQAINQWASDRTRGKIQDIIPPGAIRPDTRLVLANAIYLHALWEHRFDERSTHEAPFYLLDGSQVLAPMMRQTETLRHDEGEGYQAVELPYMGDQLAMLVILPSKGQFAEFESSLDAGRLRAIRDVLAPAYINLGLPRFEVESNLPLSQTLKGMGMPEAFSEAADFSGMSDVPLSISDVLHKAYILVNESGTEAAAVTTVIVGVTSLPPDPKELTIDRPFLFVLYDRQSGAVLFVGRVLNPVGK